MSFSTDVGAMNRLRRILEAVDDDDDCQVIDVIQDQTTRQTPDSGHEEGQYTPSDVDTDDAGSPACLVIVEDLDSDDDDDESRRSSMQTPAKTLTSPEKKTSFGSVKRRFLHRHAMASVGGECVEMVTNNNNDKEPAMSENNNAEQCVVPDEGSDTSETCNGDEEVLVGVDLSTRANSGVPPSSPAGGGGVGDVDEANTCNGVTPEGNKCVSATSTERNEVQSPEKTPEKPQADQRLAVLALHRLISCVDGSHASETSQEINRQMDVIKSVVFSTWGPLDLERGVALIMRFALDEKLSINPAASYRRIISLGNAPLPLICRCCIMFGFKLVEYPSTWTEKSWETVTRLAIGSEEAAFWLLRIIGISAFFYPRETLAGLPDGIRQLHQAVTPQIIGFLKSQMPESAFSRLEEWKALIKGAPKGTKFSSALKFMKEAVDGLRAIFREECHFDDPRLERLKENLASVGVAIPLNFSCIENKEIALILEETNSGKGVKRPLRASPQVVAEIAPPPVKIARLDPSPQTTPVPTPKCSPVQPSAPVAAPKQGPQKVANVGPRIVAIEVPVPTSASRNQPSVPVASVSPPTDPRKRVRGKSVAKAAKKSPEEQPKRLTQMHPFWEAKLKELGASFLVAGIQPFYLQDGQHNPPASPVVVPTISPKEDHQKQQNVQQQQQKPPEQSPKRAEINAQPAPLVTTTALKWPSMPSKPAPPLPSPPNQQPQPSPPEQQQVYQLQLQPQTVASSAPVRPLFPALPAGFNSYNAWLQGQRPMPVDMAVPPRPPQPPQVPGQHPPGLVNVFHGNPECGFLHHPFQNKDGFYPAMSPENLQQSLHAARMKSEATLNELNAQVRAQLFAAHYQKTLLDHQQQQQQSVGQNQQPLQHQQQQQLGHLLPQPCQPWGQPVASSPMRSLQNFVQQQQQMPSRLPTGDPNKPSLTVPRVGFNGWYPNGAYNWPQAPISWSHYGGGPMPGIQQQMAAPPPIQPRLCNAENCHDIARLACQCPGAVYCSLACQKSDWEARHSETCTYKRD